jgi:hypothetical protein
MLRLLFELEYPHWMMVAGAVLGRIAECSRLLIGEASPRKTASARPLYTCWGGFFFGTICRAALCEGVPISCPIRHTLGTP